jgi:ABC-2 type transport system ATP-binding protein
MDNDLAIDVRGMTKKFGSHVVVNSIDIQVKRGEIYGFLGPNGSGKTTFIRMLCGLLKADGGEGTCLGFDVIKDSALIKRNVGYMTQKFSYYEDMSIEENLDFVARLYEVENREEAVKASIERLGLLKRKDQLTGELSGGWKQRVALAACLIHRPQLLLLDEPTAGVDPKARRDFWETIHDLSAEGLTTLVTTHYMDEAERCHRLAYISYGNLLAKGTTQEIIKASKLTTYVVESEENDKNLSKLAHELRNIKTIQQAVAFGTNLHVSSDKPEELEAAIAPFRHSPYRWTKINSNLEDVFINLMSKSKDNF